MPTTQYAYFNEEKPQEPGFSKELISRDYDKYYSKHCDKETLESWPFPDEDVKIRTLYEAFCRNLGRIPDHKIYGTKRGPKYEWITIKELHDTAKSLAAGCMALDLVPEIEAEGTTYRFIGVQSKNRLEWNMQHVANMFMGVTTVALYDTLGADAQRYVVDQTEMTTIVCSDDLVDKILAIKTGDNHLEED
jgi:long-subunit acyl-CoA synthetase (AMP-forming)